MSLFDDVVNVGTLGLSDAVGLTNPADPPPMPDYAGAAEATAAGNLELAEYTTQANRADQITPFGESIWSQDEDGNWTQNINLSSGQQELFNLGEQSDIQLANLCLQVSGQLQDIFQTPFSLDSMGQMPNYQDQFQGVYDSMLSRVNDQVGRDRQAMGAQLEAQGIPRGSEAWYAEMERLDRQLTDARQQAELSATQQVGERQRQDIDQRRQQISEMLTGRQTPLNEYNAFRSGTQVGMPQFPGYAQQQYVPGVDHLETAMLENQYGMDLYNADISQQNAIMSGLFSLGAGGLAGR